jgi:hypothetical protein
MRYRIFGSGRPVWAGRKGFIDDVDLRLPATVMSFKATAQTSLSVYIGNKSSPDDAIARIDGEVGPWLQRLLRHGVSVRRHSRRSSASQELLTEVLDLARRATADGTPGEVQASFGLIRDCLQGAAARLRPLWRPINTNKTSAGEAFGDERAISQALPRFCRDVVASPEPLAHRQLSMAQKTALAGVREDAPRLLQPGLDLSREAPVFAHDMDAQHTYIALVSDILTLPRRVVTALQERLFDDYLPSERRLTAGSFWARYSAFRRSCSRCTSMCQTLRHLEKCGKRPPTGPTDGHRNRRSEVRILSGALGE